MPKRTDIKTILIIGAGPIVIGQACEFDYSGAQACKALRDEGYRVVLVNSNPATIMTDPDMADAVYIEPINPATVERIIAKEKPDALLPTMGGQTALNTALALAEDGTLENARRLLRFRWPQPPQLQAPPNGFMDSLHCHHPLSPEQRRFWGSIRGRISL